MFKEDDNRNVNNEPAIKFIDRRFANVNDWNKFEKDSSKNKINKNNSNRVKNKYNKYAIIENPDNIRFNNKDIKIIIKLNK